eukprot:CAMPEP_0176128318 /NCGR_PEP_ID=MMETSP0120_2-20121206/64834_1 /TAXON_ID=160619 /ORGANISM="Kryptoperidinium foliaceum, Strain CCMP 1326" /LENGTH=230 /DNA_ID=CAMNT_0017463401 /DNA_START=36 /DNA_END=728 /DNA_ORIENTATION=+
MPTSASNVESIEVSPQPRFEFPFKLHTILEDAAVQGKESIISWHPDGTSFKIHDKKELEKQVLPRYLSSPKYRSFQRQLSFYNFTFCRDPASEHFRSYYHPLFIRGRRDLCKGMERRHQKSTTKKSSKSPEVKAVEFNQTRPGVVRAPVPQRIDLGAPVPIMNNDFPPYPYCQDGQLASILPKPSTDDGNDLFKFSLEANNFLEMSNPGLTPSTARGFFPTQHFDLGFDV